MNWPSACSVLPCDGMTMAMAGTWCPLPIFTELPLLSSPPLIFPLESPWFVWWRIFPPPPPLPEDGLFMRFLAAAGDWRGMGRSSSYPTVEEDSDSLPGKASLFIHEEQMCEEEEEAKSLCKRVPACLAGRMEKRKWIEKKKKKIFPFRFFFFLFFFSFSFHFFKKENEQERSRTNTKVSGGRIKV